MRSDFGIFCRPGAGRGPILMHRGPDKIGPRPGATLVVVRRGDNLEMDAHSPFAVIDDV